MGSTNENVRGAFANFSWFIVISRRKISPHGANNNEHELTKNEKQRYLLFSFEEYLSMHNICYRKRSRNQVHVQANLYFGLRHIVKL